MRFPVLALHVEAPDFESGERRKTARQAPGVILGFSPGLPSPCSGEFTSPCCFVECGALRRPPDGTKKQKKVLRHSCKAVALARPRTPSAADRGGLQRLGRENLANKIPHTHPISRMCGKQGL